MEFDSEASPLVGVDMQNGFCHPGGGLYAAPSEEGIKEDQREGIGSALLAVLEEAACERDVTALMRGPPAPEWLER